MIQIYRHSFDVAGYVYFADIYCAHCGDKLPEIDPEGNAKSPLFVDNLWEFHPEYSEGQTNHCCQCGLDTREW